MPPSDNLESARQRFAHARNDRDLAPSALFEGGAEFVNVTPEGGSLLSGCWV